jgi:hypothetical protein
LISQQPDPNWRYAAFCDLVPAATVIRSCRGAFRYWSN